jgi:hypothetical protein
MRKPIVFFVVLLVTLSPTAAPALLLNLSTRLEIPPPALGEDITSLIGGFIIGGSSGRKILIRAVGPSLADFGLIPLADPTLELHDATGAIIATNDSWMDTQEADIRMRPRADRRPSNPPALWCSRPVIHRHYSGQ